MDRYKIDAIYCFVATSLFAIVFFNQICKPSLDNTPTLENHIVSTPYYDAQCIVGKGYVIFGPESENPFEEQAMATVIITAKQNGYVQYCWDYDVDSKDRALFTRSCEDFIKSTNKNHK